MLNIGIVQFSAVEGDIERNCSHLEELTKKYAADDIDLLCFPELCISGYDFEKVRESKHEAEFCSQLAQKYGIAIMAGITVICEGRYYDAACIWSDAGELLGEYRKIHLWDKECDFFTHGEDLAIIPFKGWNIGLLICADMRFFEISTPLTNMGADVIIYPSAWFAGWGELFELCGTMRATENQVYVIALNRASGDVEYCGGTAVINPDGSVLSRMESNEEDYEKVTIYKEKIKEARSRLPWESMKLPKVYQKFEHYRFAEVNNFDLHKD